MAVSPPAVSPPAVSPPAVSHPAVTSPTGLPIGFEDGKQDSSGRSELRQRLVQYILFRLFLVTALLIYAAMLLGAHVSVPATIDPELALPVVAGTYALLGFSAWAVRRIERPGRLTLLQLLIDSVVVTSLVVLFGGTASPFVPLFPAAVLGAAYLDGRRGALASAGLNALLLVAVALLVSDLADPAKAAAVVLTEVFGVFLVGLLAGELASKLLVQTQERKAVEHDLAQVLDHLRAGLVLLDPEGGVRTANAAAMRLFPGLVAGQVASLIPGVEGEGGAVAWEVEGAGPGQDRTLLISRSPADAGEAVLVIEDVTDLRATQRLGAREERMNAAGRFSQGLAHEIKNPLTSLSGALQLMELSEQDQRLRSIVLREVERLDRLVTDYRDARQAPALRLARVDLGEVLQQVAETFSHDVWYAAVLLELSGLELRYFCRGDSDQLRQVLWNLLLNAAQHMPKGGRIGLRLEKEESHALLAVEDQGPGIPADQLPLIFDPFFTQRSGGTGLGLALVERVVRAHGGDIRVKSRPGEGTQFLMRFPLEESRG